MTNTCSSKSTGEGTQPPVSRSSLGSGGPSMADESDELCSVMRPSEFSSDTTGTEQPPVQPASSFQHQDVADSAPVVSHQQIKQIAERVVGRKSRKRSSASELHKKNKAEKKRIKKQADIVARLRDELALHVDACVCDPHSISRNDLLRMALHQLTKERESGCALPGPDVASPNNHACSQDLMPLQVQ